MKLFLYFFRVFLIVVSITGCTKASTKSHANDILGFYMGEQTQEAIIDAANHTVLLEVELTTDLSNLALVIVLSEGATSVPSTGDSIDFSQGAIKCTVTAEDGSSRNGWSPSDLRVAVKPESD